MRCLALHSLGAFEAILDGKPITGFKTEKARALLAYLAVERGKRAHRRQSLVGLLWPDYPESSACANLRQVLTNLRQVLKDDDNQIPYLLVEGETIQLNPESDCWLDVAEFERLAAGADTTDLVSAIALYRCSFLHGFTSKDSPEFDNWTSVLREHHQGMASAALGGWRREMSRDRITRKRLVTRGSAWRWNPGRSSAHRQLMHLLALKGQRPEALAQYEACRKALKRRAGCRTLG